MDAALAPQPNFLSRERTVASADIQSLARAAGGARHSSVHRHGLWLFRLLAAAVADHWRRAAEGMRRNARAFRDARRHRLRLEDQLAGLDVHAVLRLSGLLGGGLRPLAGDGRTPQGRSRGGLLLVRRPAHLGARRLSPSDLDAVDRLRRDRRHWPRAWIYLARLDAHQMVPRPARPGDRSRHHGLWRRRDDRRAARRPADELLCHAGFAGRLADLRDARGDLFRLHGRRRAQLPGAVRRLGAGRIHAARGGQERHGDASSCASRRRMEDAAILAALGRALSQRVSRHRRSGHGLADAAGSLRRQTDRPGHGVRSAQRRSEKADRGDRGGLHRPLEPVQHRRAHRLGLGVR